jgi:6-phosphofructo-2-kinase/fructose-2,6-biphosphatase 2
LWIETIGNENYEEITDKHFTELKNSPDFIDKEDYLNRMAYYTNSYEKVGDNEGSYIKVYGEGRSLSIHEIHGFLRSKIVSFVMNLQPNSKAIYIARHGESDFNVRGLVGGDSGLSQRGVEFSTALSEFLYSDELGEDQIEDLCIWTSTMRRARDTVGDIRLIFI